MFILQELEELKEENGMLKEKIKMLEDKEVSYTNNVKALLNVLPCIATCVVYHKTLDNRLCSLRILCVSFGC